jgi:hypothetical protein
LAKVGIRDITRSFGGKHMQLRWGSNGTSRMFVLPLSPSDVRAVANTRAEIRRILREDGMLSATEHRPSPPPKTPDRITLLERRVAALEQRFAALEQQGAEGKQS